MGKPPKLFEVYSAGNFVEATSRSDFLQIGVTKYAKPILDRALTFDSTLDHAAKLALLSFDAAIRSNLSVGLPIDILRYETDSFSVAKSRLA
jgi:putative proteasome-type protease